MVLLLAWLVISGSGVPVRAQDATPEIPEGPYLPVAVWETGQEVSTSAKEGEGCPLYWNPGGLWWSPEPYQIIVRNETDAIISVTTVDAKYQTLSDDDPELFCWFEAVIPLPEADFYQVYLNEDLMKVYTPGTLPTDPNRGLTIDVGEDPFG
jgi:hypothetical protein